MTTFINLCQKKNSPFLLMRFWCYSTVKSRVSFLFSYRLYTLEVVSPLRHLWVVTKMKAIFKTKNQWQTNCCMFFIASKISIHSVEITQFYSHTLWKQRFAKEFKILWEEGISQFFTLCKWNNFSNFTKKF